MGTLHCPLCVGMWVGSSPDSAGCVTRHSSLVARGPRRINLRIIGTAFLRLTLGAPGLTPPTMSTLCPSVA